LDHRDGVHAGPSLRVVVLVDLVVCCLDGGHESVLVGRAASIDIPGVFRIVGFVAVLIEEVFVEKMVVDGHHLFFPTVYST
jgi:hypothetical protein